jgi:hypothetical protein
MATDFMSWVRSPGRDVGHLVSGSQVTLPVASPPLNTTTGTIARVFAGKGTPDQIRDVLRLVSLWQSTQGPGHADPTYELRRFAHEFMGVDCNGFVGTYLRSQFPMSPLGPEFDIGSVHSYAHERFSLGDIQPVDLVVSHGAGHVAIIGSIVSQSENEVRCMLCQSRSPNQGGVHREEVGIRRTRGHRPTFRVNGHEVAGIYGLRALEGAPRWMSARDHATVDAVIDDLT